MRPPLYHPGRAWLRVEIGALLYPRVLDPERFFLAYETLTFESGEAQRRRRVEKPREER